VIINFFKKKSKFTLSSNKVDTFLRGVGSVKIKDDKIFVKLEPFTKAVLTRNGKNYILAETQNEEKLITGKPQIGDIYTLGETEKLIVKIEQIEVSPNLYIKNSDFNEAIPQGKKTTLTVGMILLILLFLSVFFGIRQKKLNDFENLSKETLGDAVYEYDEAISLFEIDISRSRELFRSSKDKAQRLKDAGYKSDDLEALLDSIKGKEGEILGEVKVESKEFLDLSLQINDFKGSQIASTGDEMFIFDKENQNVIKVNIKTKNAKKVADREDLKNSINIASYEDRLFSLNNEGILEIKDNSQKVLDKDWDSALFYLYAGNIYLVDKSQNKIYRYSGQTSGFGAKTDWLAPGIEADFSKVKDISIDGNIWLLSETGKVSRFANGNPIAVSMSGLAVQMNNPDAIYTNEGLKNVYILDQKERRIVVFDKNGKFKIQYVNENIEGASDLVISEELKRIILIKNQKLYMIEFE